MNYPLKYVDGTNWFAETIDWESPDLHAIKKIGVLKSAVQKVSGRGHTWAVGQMYGVLATGLINVQHIFEGLHRPMSVNGDKRADEHKLIFTWTANRDAEISKDSAISYVGAPLNSVFFVIVTPNDDKKQFPDIFGWAERWGWLDKHGSVRGAPVDFESRYDRRIWSK